MNTEIFTLCASANTANGSLNIQGVFDVFRTEQVPMRSPPFAIVVNIRFRKSEQGNKTLKFSFMDADGKAALDPLEQNLTFQAANDVSTASKYHLLIIQTVRFHRFGEYSLDLAIDGKLIGSIPLYILKPLK